MKGGPVFLLMKRDNSSNVARHHTAQYCTILSLTVIHNTLLYTHTSLYALLITIFDYAMYRNLLMMV